MVNRKSSIENRQSKIYILHGWSYSLEKWNPFIKIMQANNLDPILLKIPGLTEKIDKPWAIDNYIDWLYDKTKNEDRIVLMGHSNGGRLAMNFCIAHPGKVEKLFLIDSAGIYHNDLYLRIKKTVFKTIAKAGKKISKNDLAKKALYKLTGQSDYKNADEIMRKTMINLIESDKVLSPEKITTQTFIIWGKDDGITPISDGKLLNEQIVNSKLYIVNNSRHSPQFTNPEEVAEIILDSLKGK